MSNPLDRGYDSGSYILVLYDWFATKFDLIADINVIIVFGDINDVLLTLNGIVPIDVSSK